MVQVSPDVVVAAWVEAHHADAPAAARGLLRELVRGFDGWGDGSTLGDLWEVVVAALA